MKNCVFKIYIDVNCQITCTSYDRQWKM